MAAYIIVEIEVTDPVGFEEYRGQVAPTIEQHGGKYLVRGGTCETLEGDWKPKRIVVLQFDDMQRARAWRTQTNTVSPGSCVSARRRHE